MYENQLKTYETAIALPFRFTPQGGIAMAQSQTQVWADRVKGALNTRFGERVMFSRFGTEIPTHQWDTVTDTEEIILTEVENLFTAFFPTLILDQVTVEHDEVNNVVIVDVEYTTPSMDKITTNVGLAVVAGNLPLFEEPR
jgi:phage baseplate assembly protein W